MGGDSDSEDLSWLPSKASGTPSFLTSVEGTPGHENLDAASSIGTAVLLMCSRSAGGERGGESYLPLHLLLNLDSWNYILCQW